MSTQSIEIHPAERNDAAFREAAQSLAQQLAERGYGEYLLQPGDATVYPFIVLQAGRSVPRSGTEPVVRRDFLVILAASFGRGYEWAGQRMHWDYCAGKWTTDGHEWTGRVVASLLNQLSPLVQP